MSESSGTLYTARQVSAALGVSTAMTRKYAATFEAITGEPIKQHARDGRLYTREQLDTLVTTKGYVDGNAGMSVETALKIALGRAETAVKEPPGVGIDTVAFAEAILAELRGLRLANERLLERLEAVETRQLPSAAPPDPVDDAPEGKPVDIPVGSPDDPPGVFVKAARWLERAIRDISGR
jgi:hypothetical protein